MKQEIPQLQPFNPHISRSTRYGGDVFFLVMKKSYRTHGGPEVEGTNFSVFHPHFLFNFPLLELDHTHLNHSSLFLRASHLLLCFCSYLALFTSPFCLSMYHKLPHKLEKIMSMMRYLQHHLIHIHAHRTPPPPPPIP